MTIKIGFYIVIKNNNICEKKFEKFLTRKVKNKIYLCMENRFCHKNDSKKERIDGTNKSLVL